MHVNALSDVGLVRKDNEDNYLVSPERGLFVVADGMGGHVGGQIASTLAIQAIDEYIELSILETVKPGDLLQQALLKANEHIYNHGETKQYYGMGTTVTAALFYQNNLHIAHIGDSRAYQLRDNVLTLLTRDHSLVNEMLQSGSITLEEAQNHPQRNILTRALGTKEEPQVDVFTVPAQSGDMLVLCTDGLYNQVHEEDILKVIQEAQADLKVAVRNLVNLALERGGNDNITVVVVQYE